MLTAFLTLRLALVYQQEKSGNFPFRPFFQERFKKVRSSLKNPQLQSVLDFLQANFQNYVGALILLALLSCFFKGMLSFVAVNYLALQLLTCPLPCLKTILSPETLNKLSDVVVAALVAMMSCAIRRCGGKGFVCA